MWSLMVGILWLRFEVLYVQVIAVAKIGFLSEKPPAFQGISRGTLANCEF